MASRQDIRITDVPFSSVPDTNSTVFINDNGKLRQTDLTTIAKYSELYTAIIEAHNTGLQSLETTKTQLEQALVDLTNEKFEIINKDHAENLAELTALYENSVQNINALIENGHDKLLNDIAAVDDLRIKVTELNNGLNDVVIIRLKNSKTKSELESELNTIYQRVGNKRCIITGIVNWCEIFGYIYFESENVWHGGFTSYWHWEYSGLTTFNSIAKDDTGFYWWESNNITMTSRE